MDVILKDDGGEHISPADILLGSTPQPLLPQQDSNGGDCEMQIDPDYDDGGDEMADSPALFLRRFWKKVSAEPVTFDCFRSPKTQAYACTLKLPMPGKEPRLFRSPPVYATKRSATRALAEYAIQCGILGEAGRNMNLLDKTTNPAAIAGPSRGPFDGSNNPRFVLPGDTDVHQSAVVLLNLAVQRNCVEPPTVVLDYVHHTSDAGSGQPFRGPLYRCDLRVRITPDLQEVYSTSQAFPSTRLAKEAVAQLALQDGVVFLFKLHNSMTTKLCQTLGLPIPSTLEEHDSTDEENTAGILGQLVQQVARNPNAISTEFIRGTSDTADLCGAKMIIHLTKQDSRVYEMPAVFRNKKEAKEAVCRLAVRLGLRKELESQLNLSKASHRALQSFNRNDTVSRAPVSQSHLLGSTIESSVARLNLWAQSHADISDSPTYTFSEEAGTAGFGGRTEPRFGCKLTIQFSDTVQHFEVATLYPNKKLAKEAAAHLAVQSGLGGASSSNSLRLIPTQPDVPPIYNASINHLSDEIHKSRSHSYETHKNSRVIDLASRTVRQVTSPSTMAVRQDDSGTPSSLASTSQRQTEGPKSARLLAHYSSTASSTVSASSLQPNLRVLQQQIQQMFPEDGLSRLMFQQHADSRTGLFRGTLCLKLADNRFMTFEEDALHGSIALCQEKLAAKALSGNLWTQLSTIAQQTSQAVASGRAEVAQVDRSYHPVSYVYQVCNLLLGSEAAHKPVFEVFQPSAGRLFASKLMLPTDPPKTYECLPQYKNKAAAKEAVAELAISGGLVDFLKQQTLRLGEEKGLAGQGNGDLSEKSCATLTKLRQISVNSNGKRPLQASDDSTDSQPCVGRLTAYCKETNRPMPVFRNLEVPQQDKTLSPKLFVSVTIGELVFQVDGKIKQQEGGASASERLAKRVLRHLMTEEANRDGQSST